ncbi:DoxX family membrane protein [Amycolatopsis samaneae]
MSGVDDTDDASRSGDLGLLVLRLALGAIMGAHGLQHLFGLFGGPGIGGFARALETFGYHKQTTLLSWVTGITEVGGSVLVIAGLFTWLGAAGLLGVAVNIVFAKFHGGFFQGSGQGFEFELLLGVVALALLFTGAGRIALDRNTPWRRRPFPFAVGGVLLAAAASVVVLTLTR